MSAEDNRGSKPASEITRRANAAVAMIDKEVFLPAPEDSWVCSRKWCGYYDTCPFASGAKRHST